MKAKILNYAPVGLSLVFGLLAVFELSACGGNSAASSSATDDSASGAVAGAVGGGLTTSLSSGTQASMRYQVPPSIARSIKNAFDPMPNALAAGLCPTFVSSSGSGCSASGSSMYLTYTACSFTGVATWNGVQELSMSSGTASCGTFPNPGASGTLYRQFVTSSGVNTAGSATVAAGGVTETIDDATANLGNFDGDTIAAVNPNSGYGDAVLFNSAGARTSLTFGHHISVTGDFDHSLSGALSITETAGAASRSVSGKVTLYHNLLKVIATSTIDVVHENICCLPVSGKISTVYSAGSNVNPTNAGSAYVGKTEVMTFTGCGTATLQKIDGTTSNVNILRCF